MTRILPPTVKIYNAYKQSLYRVGGVTIKIGQYPQGIPKHLENVTFVLFSAYNPGGRLRTLGWNMGMMQKLKEYLVSYQYFEGKGSLKGISEPLFMVNINPYKAIGLARKFRQNAVVIVRAQRRSKLFFLA